MGLHHSLPEDEVHEVFNSSPTMFESWGFAQLRNIHSVYLSSNADFAISSREMASLIKDAVPEGDVAVHRILKTFAPKSEEITAPPPAAKSPTQSSRGGGTSSDSQAAKPSPSVDVLLVLSGLVLSSSTLSYPQKVSFLTSLFSLSSPPGLTYDELFVGLHTTCVSLCLLLSSTELSPGVFPTPAQPEDADLERYCDDIFLAAGVDPNQQGKGAGMEGTVAAEHVLAWLEGVPAGGIGGKGKEKGITIAGVMVGLDLLDEEEAREIERIDAAKDKARGGTKKHHKKKH
jgi:hypothetical protein